MNLKSRSSFFRLQKSCDCVLRGNRKILKSSFLLCFFILSILVMCFHVADVHEGGTENYGFCFAMIMLDLVIISN